MKKICLSLVLVVPVLMFAQEDMNATMTSDTTAMMADTTAAMGTENTMYDSTMFGTETETEAPAMEEDEYMVEEEGASENAYTVGVNFGISPVFSSGLGEVDPGMNYGVVIGTPFGINLGPMGLDFGAEIGYYNFPLSNGNDTTVKGPIVLATVNSTLLNAGGGALSAGIGAGYVGASLGGTVGVNYKYGIGNTGVSINGFGRANISLDPGNGTSGVYWITVGAMVSYALGM